MRSKSHLGAYLRRQRARLGAPKAITATAHKLTRILDNLVHYGLAYVRQTEEPYAEQVQQRLEKQFAEAGKGTGLRVEEGRAGRPGNDPVAGSTS